MCFCVVRRLLVWGAGKQMLLSAELSVALRGHTVHIPLTSPTSNCHHHLCHRHHHCRHHPNHLHHHYYHHCRHRSNHHRRHHHRLPKGTNGLNNWADSGSAAGIFSVHFQDFFCRTQTLCVPCSLRLVLLVVGRGCCPAAGDGDTEGSCLHWGLWWKPNSHLSSPLIHKAAWPQTWSPIISDNTANASLLPSCSTSSLCREFHGLQYSWAHKHRLCTRRSSARIANYLSGANLQGESCKQICPKTWMIVPFRVEQH